MRVRVGGGNGSVLGLLPAPPVLHYQQGYGPGITQQNAMGTASYAPDTDTLYYVGTLDRATKGHEVGHAVDDQLLTDGDRHYFQRLMHAPPGEWRTGTGLQGGATSPSEWFADYYQAAALKLDPRRESQAAYAQVGPKRLIRFEKALTRLAKRRGITQPYQ
jgi:hypothetical protein